MKTRRKWLIGGLAALLLAVAGVAVAQLPNTLNVSSAPSGTAPAIRAAGIDANVSINLIPKGSGTVQVSGTPITVSGGTFTSLNVNPGPLNVTGPLFVQVGSTAVLKRVPAVLAHNITPTGNVGAGEDTVTSYTFLANTLAVNGESLDLDAIAFTAANATGKRWRVRWGAGATVVLDSTSVGFNNHAVNIRCIIQRVTAASQNVSCMGQSTPPITTGQAWNVGLGAGNSSQLLAEDLTAPQTIIITAEAGANDDQVVRSSRVVWYPVGQ